MRRGMTGRYGRASWVAGALALGCLIIAARPSAAKQQSFLDSDEAKEADYKRGCAITDYSGMVEADGIDWAWIDSSAKIGGPGDIQIVAVKNVSDVTDASVASNVEQDFKQAFTRIGKSPGASGMKFTSCVFWVDRANAAKAWVPFAGAHLMQAGVGIEATITDSSGKTVAKLRHNGRSGQSPSDAAAAIVDDLVNFIAKH
jgi:hypothetical protein